MKAIDAEKLKEWAEHQCSPKTTRVRCNDLNWEPHQQRRALALALIAANEEISEKDRLEELRRKREQPWIERWRVETGKHNTLPDYGRFLHWLFDKLDAHRDLVNAVRAIGYSDRTKMDWDRLRDALAAVDREG